MKYLIANLIMGLCLLFGPNTFAQSDNEFTIPLSNPGKSGKLEVDINYGSVTVKCTPRKDVLVRYESIDAKKVKKDDEKVGLRKVSSGLANLEAYEENNEVVIESSSWNKGLNIIVEAPYDMDMKLSTYNNGKIILEGAKGNIEIENFNGPITAKNISGSLIADTYNGDILVTFAKITPDMPMAFTTYNGDVDLTLPSNTKATVKARTNRGDIYTGFDMKLENAKPKVQEDKRKFFLDGWVTGKINGGGPEFRMENSNGDIFIRKSGS
jgi:hypothetical protein